MVLTVTPSSRLSLARLRLVLMQVREVLFMYHVMDVIRGLQDFSFQPLLCAEVMVTSVRVIDDINAYCVKYFGPGQEGYP